MKETVECRLVLNLRYRKLTETPECRIPQLVACKTDLEFSTSHAISTEPFFLNVPRHGDAQQLNIVGISFFIFSSS